MAVTKLSQSDKVYLGLNAVGLVGITIVLAAAVLTNRKRGDWTRRGFMWHFMALAYVLSYILLNIIYVSIYRHRNLRATIILPIAFAFAALADVSYIVVFVQLLSGFKSVRDGKRHDPFRIVHYVLLSIMLLLAVIVFAYGMAMAATRNTLLNYNRAVGGWVALYFFLCIDILIFGVDFLRNGLAPKAHKGLLFGAIIALLIRAVYQLIAAIVFSWVNIRTTEALMASQYAGSIFSIWFPVIVSAFIVALGAKKEWVAYDPGYPNPRPTPGSQEQKTVPELAGQGTYPPQGYIPQAGYAPQGGYAPPNAYYPQGGYAPQGQWGGPWPGQQQFMPATELSNGAHPAAAELPTAGNPNDAVGDQSHTTK